MGFPPPRKLALQVLLAGVSCLLALVLAEAAVRLAAHRILREAEFIAVGTVFKVDDAPVGFSLQPDSTRIVAKGGAFMIRERISPQGLRDIVHPPGKRPGARRILVLGDSFMYGDGVEVEETMPRRLAGLMRDVEVVNAGVRAYDLGQEYLYFKDRAHAFQPDLVLLAFFVNDLVPDVTLEAVDGLDTLPLFYRRKPEVVAREREAASGSLRSRISSSLRSRSMLWVLVRKRLDDMRLARRARPAARRNNAADINYLSAFHSAPDDGSVPDDWKRAWCILDALKDQAGSREARLAVILIPAPWQLSQDEWDRWVEWLGVEPASLGRSRPQEMMMRWCEASGTPCLDLLGELEGADRKRLYFRHDHHWTAEGHEVAARAVSAFLEDRRLP